MQQLGTTYKNKEDEHSAFRNKWNIQVGPLFHFLYLGFRVEKRMMLNVTLGMSRRLLTIDDIIIFGS
jgi:hypothetical protein